jgi:hypothetical protein
MDIGKDGQPHISSASIIAPVPARVLRDIKQQAACGVQWQDIRALKRRDLTKATRRRANRARSDKCAP